MKGWIQWQYTPYVSSGSTCSSFLYLPAPFLTSGIGYQNRWHMSKENHWRLGSLPRGKYKIILLTSVGYPTPPPVIEWALAYQG